MAEYNKSLAWHAVTAPFLSLKINLVMRMSLSWANYYIFISDKANQVLKCSIVVHIIAFGILDQIIFSVSEHLTDSRRI